MKAISLLLAIASSTALAGREKLACISDSGDRYVLSTKSFDTREYSRFLQHCKTKVLQGQVCYEGTKRRVNRIIEQLDARNALGEKFSLKTTKQTRGVYSYVVREKYISFYLEPFYPCRHPTDPFGCGARRIETEQERSTTRKIKRCRK